MFISSFVSGNCLNASKLVKFQIYICTRISSLLLWAPGKIPLPSELQYSLYSVDIQCHSYFRTRVQYIRAIRSCQQKEESSETSIQHTNIFGMQAARILLITCTRHYTLFTNVIYLLIQDKRTFQHRYRKHKIINKYIRMQIFKENSTNMYIYSHYQLGLKIESNVKKITGVG